MPVKFKPSQTIKDRTTGKLRTENYYIKSMSRADLFTELNKSNNAPKIKQKLRNELARRKVKIEWVPKES